MTVDSGRLVAVSADGFVCGRWQSRPHETVLSEQSTTIRDSFVRPHHWHGCTVSTVPADEQTPGIGQRWTPPGQREDVS